MTREELSKAIEESKQRLQDLQREIVEATEWADYLAEEQERENNAHKCENDR